jgi:acetylornithine deacetylase/succinyl-diaminopimelate desuccinylase-like protein
MPGPVDDILKFVDSNKGPYVDELCGWLRMASIGTDPNYTPEVRKAAGWLKQRFESMGVSAELIETVGHPIVYAETPPVPGAPTVLVYGHYDVQPPDPLELWTSPPFEPAIRDQKVYARGATDDKGQVLTHVLSCEAWLKTRGKLPVQIKYLIEGEEESGSKGLNEFLSGKYDGKGPAVQQRLASDICVISDNSQYGPGKPAITYGLRGLAYYEIHLTGPNRDLHSGAFGGTVRNPVNTLCQMLAALHDSEGRVAVPGFYDDVIPLTERERGEYRNLGFVESDFRKSLGIAAEHGEAGYTSIERRWARPTFDINGIWGGYTGEGAKTVLPARASAKFSFRLVPDQDPEKITRLVEKRLRELCPPGVTMELVDMHGARGVLVPLDNQFVDPAARAIEGGFGKRPVFIRSGGTIPVVGYFKQLLDIDTLLLGWGQDDDNPHSPNEKFSLEDFHRGIRTSVALWQELAIVKSRR